MLIKYTKIWVYGIYFHLMMISSGIVFSYYNVEIIKKEKGLSQSIITCGMTDSRGFVWFGTTNGLNRYDGKEFVVFKQLFNDSNSISNNSIYAITEDKDGQIWISDADGIVNRMNPSTGKSKKYKIFDKENSIQPISLFTDSDGKLWFLGSSSYGFCAFYNEIKDKFEIFKSGKPIIDTLLSNLRFYSDYFLGKDGCTILKIHQLNNYTASLDNIAYNDTKLLVFQPKKNYYRILDKYKDFNIVKILGSDSCGNPYIQLINNFDPFKIVKLNLKNLEYEETNYEIDKKWEKHGFRISPFYFDNKLFVSVKKINGKELANLTKMDGLYQFNGTGYLEFSLNNQIHAYTSVYLNMNFFQSKKIFSPINKIIWDYHDNGLLKISPNTKKVYTYRLNTKDKKSLSNNTCRSVFVDAKNNIWVGTFNGLNKFETLTKSWKHYLYSDAEQTTLNNQINVITEDKYRIIAGTNNGIYLIEKVTGKIHNLDYLKFSKYNQKEFGKRIWGLLVDNNDLWIGIIGRGLCKYNFLTKVVKVYFHSDSIANSISDNRILNIFKDKKNNIWIGTQNGLNRYLSNIDGFKEYKNQTNNLKTICGNSIWSICEDKTGNLWIGSYGVGLNKYNPASDDFSNITVLDGLPDDGIKSMVFDNDNNMWIGSTNGLIKYNQMSKRFTRYSSNDGFQGDEYSYHSAAITQDNKLVFGGLNGVSIFSPLELQNNLNVPKILISKFYIGDKLKSFFLKDGDTIIKPWETDYIKIQVSALDYINSNLNQYAYKIIGLHEDWIDLNNHNTIILAGIEPGNYNLKIKASNNDGIWNETGISIFLSITPPFWMTFWFKSIIYLTIILLLFFFLFDVLRRRHEKEVSKRKIVSLQLKALQAQINPHFIFNSLNSILNLILQDEKEKSMQYLSKFSKLLRKVIERSRADNIPLIDEIEHIKLYFELEQLRFNDKFSYTIDIDSKINIEEIIVPALFLQPYIENSIKHGNIHQIENGKVDIIFKEHDTNLHVNIIDNGIGRKNPLEINSDNKNYHKSFGMQISKERLAMINSKVFVSDLTDYNGLPIGTKVEIIIYNYKLKNG